MRFLSAALGLLGLTASIVPAAAQASPAEAAAVIASLPTCGQLCLATATADLPCSPYDWTCVCPRTAVVGEITGCVMANCTMPRDKLTMEKFANEFCGVESEDRRPLVWIVGIVFGALGVLAFCLRCLARFVGSRTWGWDDTVMCLVMCCAIPLAVLSIPLSQHGLGLDMWAVSFDDITDILHYYYFDEVIYISALALTKVSILFFYLKVFPKKAFRIMTWILIGANLTYMVVFDLLLIFQCKPLYGAWTFWDGTFEGECISINVLGWTAAAFNIVLDLSVIMLPMPELFQLSMSLRKRLQIVAMFAVGLFITVVSIVRLHSLIQFGNTQNLTQDYVEVGYWSTIEVPVGVICACMPSIRSLFSLAFPRVFGTTRYGGKSYGGSSFGGGGGGGSGVPRLASANRAPPKNAISVKQEWTVLSDPVDNISFEEHDSRPRANSDVELVHVRSPTADLESGPTRKITLRKEQGQWGSRVHMREEPV
ncbi:hypothetical protein F4780DRAFT_791020 [Xylariomycetidae sp. FL0641]|nr:hypothetical protein F4780DRAFT_791020 [Xylariomycetidae sp. FL0641]